MKPPARRAFGYHSPVRYLLALLAFAGAALAAPGFNVRDFGAAAGGVRKDTAAIARAIEACSKAGGGTVRFPPGKYLTFLRVRGASSDGVALEGNHLRNAEQPFVLEKK